MKQCLFGNDRKAWTRLLACLIAVILLCSFGAALVSSGLGQIKVTHLVIDARGGALECDLYYPRNTSSEDKLPAISVAHGGSVSKGVVRGIAEELARRGFVVLSANAYGVGYSEHPLLDDGGQGPVDYNFLFSPLGLLDTVDYLRSLEFVDSSRIGIFGHSWGSTRAQMVAVADCGYYTYNDLMINVLCDTFGQQFTLEEIDEDAGELARERLNADQLAYYEDLAQRTREAFDSKVFSLVLTGSSPQASLETPQVVTVGGHEVERYCQVNVAYVNGRYDSNGAGALWREDGTADYFDGNAQIGTWYSIEGSGQYAALGDVSDISVLDSETLSQSIADRASRIVLYNSESHSKNFFSTATTSDVCRLFEQTLHYNGGELGAADADPVDADSNIWPVRTAFNTAAMLAMLAMIFPLAALLLSKESFAGCVTAPASRSAVVSRPVRIVLSVGVVAATFVSIYIANAKGVMFFPMTFFWPLAGASGNALLFILLLGGLSLVLLVAAALAIKKTSGESALPRLNLNLGVKGVLKSLAVAALIILAGYLACVTVEYLFNQDFRLWTTQFTHLSVDSWFIVLRYAVFFVPVFLLTGSVSVLTLREDAPAWKDDLAAVVVGSAGVWICLACDLLSYLAWTGRSFSPFTCSYSMLLLVPLTVLINRRLYRRTNSVWLGAFVNALLIAWVLVCSNGTSDMYYGNTLVSVIFGA